MKKSELIFNLISIPVDIAALAAAGIVSFYLRLYAQRYEAVGPVLFDLQLGDLMHVLERVIPVLLIVFALLGLYNLRGTRRFIHEFNRILVGTSLGMLVAIVLFFFNQSIFPSRFIILSAWALSILFIIFGRALLKGIQKLLFSRGYGLHRLVIINGQGMDAELIQSMLKDKSYGYKVIAELENKEGLITELEQLYNTSVIDEIMQANPNVTTKENLALVEFARNKGIQFSFVPNLFEVQRNVIELNNFKGVPVISLKNTPLDGWGRVAKRIFDVFASIICIVITLPAYLAIMVAIKLDSKGPIHYGALRGGRGKDFKFYKFRSMHTHLSVGDGYGGAEAEKVRQELWKQSARGGADGAFLKIKNDPRVTRVGRFIRRTKVDELPQFWHVLRGDMSMTGPRAHVLDEVERYRNRYRRMFSIKPGIFGLSQLAQMSWPDLPFEEEIRLNTYYIENWSLWWDIKILVKTFYMLFFAPKPTDDY
jgi:exopolysaccharide biosynthesis polyprenyl glycosylphosphotransferase